MTVDEVAQRLRAGLDLGLVYAVNPAGVAVAVSEEVAYPLFKRNPDGRAALREFLAECLNNADLILEARRTRGDWKVLDCVDSPKLEDVL